MDTIGTQKEHRESVLPEARSETGLLIGSSAFRIDLLPVEVILSKISQTTVS